MGTSVGAMVFTEHGWRADASLNVAWTGFTLVVLLLRGPHCSRYTWVGWQGGFELRRSRVVARQEAERDDAAAAAAEKQSSAREDDAKEAAREENSSPASSTPLEVDGGEKTGGKAEREGVEM
ncbi:hypothetical protein LXA43DRAFT_1018514, partial [Ganoderma leucocontextum]